MNKWFYDGPVVIFGKAAGNFKGETYADTKAKAKSNLTYQCKKKMNVNPNYGKVELIGEIRKES